MDDWTSLVIENAKTMPTSDFFPEIQIQIQLILLVEQIQRQIMACLFTLKCVSCSTPYELHFTEFGLCPAPPMNYILQNLVCVQEMWS